MSMFQKLTDVYEAMIDWPKRLAHEEPFYRRLFAEHSVQSVVDTACGTGRPTRDFVYAGDVAALVPQFITGYESSDPVNISTQTETSIRDLAATIGELTGYRGTATRSWISGV